MKRKKTKKFNYLKLFLCIAVIIVVGIIIANVNKKQDNQVVAETNTANENKIEENVMVVETSANVVKEENNVETKRDFSNLKETEKLGSEGLPVVMYHFFYDKSKGEKAKDGNWMEISDFEDHLKYLTEEGYYFPTWDEVSDYIDGKTTLPKKSIVLTVDDGEESFFRVALPVIKKYDVLVTNFLVTAWNGWFKYDYPAKQVSYQSHSDNMHRSGAKGKGVILSLSYEDKLKDIKQSREVLGDDCITFCYPYGHYDAEAEKAVKEAGFKMAFTTELGRVKVGMDKYALPRLRTSSKTNLAAFKNVIK